MSVSDATRLSLGLVVSLACWAQSAQTPTAVAPLPRLKFVVHYRSLQPPTLTVPEGRYLMEINTGKIHSAMNFDFEDEGKTSKASSKSTTGQAIHFVTVDLKPGKFTLTVPGLPDRWQSVITVTKKQ